MTRDEEPPVDQSYQPHPLPSTDDDPAEPRDPNVHRDFKHPLDNDPYDPNMDVSPTGPGRPPGPGTDPDDLPDGPTRFPDGPGEVDPPAPTHDEMI